MITKVVIIGIVLVFLILLLLTFMLMIFPAFFSKKNKQNSQVVVSDKVKTVESVKVKSDNIVIQNNNINDDYTLISVITAAISAYRQSIGENADLSSFKVVAFRKAKRR